MSELTNCECGNYAAVLATTEDEHGEAGWTETEGITCNALTARTFAPGHDARLKGYLIRWGTRELDVLNRATNDVASAEHHADRYGFGHMVRAGISLGQAKAEVAKAKADEKHAKQAERAEAKAAKKAAKATPAPEEAKPEPVTVTARVGRWEYTGTIDEAGFTYTDKQGNTKTTEQFTVIG